eukprot:7945942-Heterocapsa_arctica.AAC.1
MGLLHYQAAIQDIRCDEDYGNFSQRYPGQNESGPRGPCGTTPSRRHRRDQDPHQQGRLLRRFRRGPEDSRLDYVYG